ncbi:MAG TPA: hypothetical protein VGI39_39670 [Polyangiaceae bacterium]|jgi:hypothetical protein
MTMHGTAIPPPGRQRGVDSALLYRTTRWKNPTPHTMRFLLHDSANIARLVTIDPGETIELPSEFDNAIHRVDCGQDFCHKGAGKVGGGWFCLKGHNGTIIGGLAPLLLRLDGVVEELDSALDPQASLKKKAEADLAAASLVAHQAREAQLIAAAHAQAAGSAMVAPPPPPPPPPNAAEPTAPAPPVQAASTAPSAPTGGPPPANARQNRRE